MGGPLTALPQLLQIVLSGLDLLVPSQPPAELAGGFLLRRRGKIPLNNLILQAIAA